MKSPDPTFRPSPLACFGRICLLAFSLSWLPRTNAAEHSIARVWDEEILAAIRIDIPNPPVHARNLFHLSAAMYDAWAAYDTTAVGHLYRGKHTVPDVAAARREAISYAAYRILRQRYALSRNAVTTLGVLDARFAALGYDKDNQSTDVSTPAGLGNTVFNTLAVYVAEDGARQNFGYADYPTNSGGYVSFNLPLLITVGGTLAVDVNRWQRLAITDATTQNGIPVESIQKFLGAQWKWVRPFALTRTDPDLPWIDPGPPPRLGTATDAQFRAEVIEVIQRASELTPDDGVMLDISPGVFGNSPLGTNNPQGHPLNPATGQPYAPNVVKRGDFARVLAEFWADGPNSETPPGHWNTLANQAADHPDFVRKIGGVGPVVDELEWDVKLYFAMNAALHDAACAAWAIKRHYDGWRPIAAVRFMGQLGQSSDPNTAFYHPNGLPLVPGVVEQASIATVGEGGRHRGFPIGTVLIRSWPGQPNNPTNQYSGVFWMRPENWFTYQKRTFVSPAFPGYISGHSTFSRAAAEVLTAMTGSPFFPGGLATFTAQADKFLTTEKGPSADVQLQWGTYYDAADQAGMSRIWGGIHVSSDDFNGRRTGAEVGQRAWALAREYFDGSLVNRPELASLQASGNGQVILECDTVRGLTYRLQSTASLSEPFTDEPGGSFQATDSPTRRTNAVETARFFRVTRE
jgi:hypothetical protein